MKKLLASVLIITLFVADAQAQTGKIRPKSIGVSLILNDFVTPQRLRNSSLSEVFRNKRWAEFRDMNTGLAVNYIKGLTPHIDFAGTLGFSSVNMPLPGKSFFRDAILFEADATGNFKMLEESAKLNFYLIAGIGASKYTNIFGAFLPLGGGAKLNLFNDTQLAIQMQYRVPVTPEANNYHFQTSIGISGVLFGRRRM